MLKISKNRVNQIVYIGSKYQNFGNLLNVDLDSNSKFYFWDVTTEKVLVRNILYTDIDLSSETTTVFSDPESMLAYIQNNILTFDRNDLLIEDLPPLP